MNKIGYSPITFKSQDNKNSIYPNKYTEIKVEMNPFISTFTHFSNKHHNKKDSYLTNVGYKNAKNGSLISTIIAPIFFIFTVKSSKNKKELMKNALFSAIGGIAIGAIYSMLNAPLLVIRELSKDNSKN